MHFITPETPFGSDVLIASVECNDQYVNVAVDWTDVAGDYFHRL